MAFAARILMIFVLLPLGASSAAWANTVRTIYQFTGGADGGNPVSGLVVGPGGHLYGATATSIYSVYRDRKDHWAVRSVFAMPVFITRGYTSIVGTPKTLYVLGAGKVCGPFSRPCGSVVSLTPPAAGKTAWTSTTLYEFGGGSDGMEPGGIVLAPDGAIYGTTTTGGGAAACGSGVGCGTLFRLALSGSKWSETVLHRFSGGSDGLRPLGAPTLDDVGNVYFATEEGGGTKPATASVRPASGEAQPASCAGDGTVGYYSLEEKKEQIVWYALCVSFGPIYADAVIALGHAYDDATSPHVDGGPAEPAAVAAPAKGVLFMSSGGGADTSGCPALDNSGCGTISQLARPTGGSGAWTIRTVHNFTGADGALPAGNLVPVDGKTAYGIATTYGASCTGKDGCGTIFRLVKSGGNWVWNGIAHRFTGGTAGTQPIPQMVHYGSQIFGTTNAGGSANRGIVFSMTP